MLAIRMLEIMIGVSTFVFVFGAIMAIYYEIERVITWRRIKRQYGVKLIGRMKTNNK